MQIIGTATLTPPLLGPPIRQAKPACADRFPPYMAAARIEGGGAQTRWGMGASLGCEPTVRAEPSSTRREFVAFLSTGFFFFPSVEEVSQAVNSSASPHLPSAAVAADRQVPRSLSRPTPMAPAERPFDRMDAQHLSPGGGGGALPPRGDFPHVVEFSLCLSLPSRRRRMSSFLGSSHPAAVEPVFSLHRAARLVLAPLGTAHGRSALIIPYSCCTRTLVLSCAQARENVLEHHCDAAIATLSTGTSPDPQVALWASR